VKLPAHTGRAYGKCRYDYRIGFDSTAGVRYRPPRLQSWASRRLALERTCSCFQITGILKRLDKLETLSYINGVLGYSRNIDPGIFKGNCIASRGGKIRRDHLEETKQILLKSMDEGKIIPSVLNTQLVKTRWQEARHGIHHVRQDHS
jgi:hypothetical protein